MSALNESGGAISQAYMNSRPTNYSRTPLTSEVFKELAKRTEQGKAHRAAAWKQCDPNGAYSCLRRRPAISEPVLWLTGKNHASGSLTTQAMVMSLWPNLMHGFRSGSSNRQHCVQMRQSGYGARSDPAIFEPTLIQQTSWSKEGWAVPDPPPRTISFSSQSSGLPMPNCASLRACSTPSASLMAGVGVRL